MAEFETKSTATSTREETEGPKSAEPTVDTVKVIRSLLTDWCQRESLALTRQATVQTDDADHGDDDQGQLQTQPTRAAKWPLAALVKALTRIGRVDCARLVQLCQIQTQPEPSSPKEPSNASTCTTSCVSTSSSPAS